VNGYPPGMEASIRLNYPAAIPVGHVIEVTEFLDTRPEKKRRSPPRGEPFQMPVILDLDTGIRYMNHRHVSRGDNGGNDFVTNSYPSAIRSDLVVSRVYRATVTACSLLMIEGLSGQHTTLGIAPVDTPAPGTAQHQGR
jgi:hypothetical protein